MADMNKTYYLLPGKGPIVKKGLPGGKIEAKAEPVKITPAQLIVIEQNLDYMISMKTIADTEGVEKLAVALRAEAEKADAESSGKSPARIALEKEASDLGIEFTDRTSGKMLKDMIDSEKAKPANMDDLLKQAEELGIDVPADATEEELKTLIELELNK